jgi:hypothetical protein
MPCNCLSSLERQQVAKDYAESVSAAFVEDVGGFCPEMINYVVEHIVSRLVYVQIISSEFSEGRERIVNDDVAVERAAKQLFEMSRTAPAVLSEILNEMRVVRGEKNASH